MKSPGSVGAEMLCLLTNLFICDFNAVIKEEKYKMQTQQKGYLILMWDRECFVRVGLGQVMLNKWKCNS